MTKKIVVGNWKMHTTVAEGTTLLQEIIQKLKNSVGIEVVIAPPFTHISTFAQHLSGTSIKLGAQNCAHKPFGAYTGEISSAQLKALDVKYVIIGHSERRQYHGEDHALLRDKLQAILAQNMHPIFCCGEALEVRTQQSHENFIKMQLEEGLFKCTAGHIQHTLIAYEPIWAIGTEKSASPAQAQAMHTYIRTLLAKTYGESIAKTIPILYGGSVKADNVSALLDCQDIDGVLVGSASLDAKSFENIVKTYAKATC